MNEMKHRLATAAFLAALMAFWAAPPTGAQSVFTDHGIAANVAECRGVALVRDGAGQPLVIGMTLDESKLGYILVTDIDSGETKQYPYPEGAGNSPVYASLASRNGRLYTGAGKVLLEFDITGRRWLFQGVPVKDAECFVGSAIADGPDGLIYIGTYPNSHLASFDPRTKEMKDFGTLDPEEKYFDSLVLDKAGWAYAGIGTARWNIVAFNPKTGERRPILAEAERKLGTANVYIGEDGIVYGNAGDLWFRLDEGRGERILKDQASPPAATGAIRWGARTGTFADGRKLLSYDLENRVLRIAAAETGEEKRMAFDYQAGGVGVTSLAVGPGGLVYASTSHPMHLVKLDPGAKSLHDLGPIPKVGGGNFCAMAGLGDLLFGAQYSAGALWAYDASKPWNPAGSNPENPRELTVWTADICRPRTALVHPDGKHVLYAGFADYGRTGGGIGIYNLETAEATLLTADKDLLPGHSTITLKALPDGNLVGGTSIEAPGGGHLTAKAAEIYIMDWKTRTIAFHAPLVEDGGDIISLEVSKDGKVFGLSAKSIFFVFDPKTRRIVHREDFSAYGAVPRHALHWGKDGKLYALLSKVILRVDPALFRHEKLADTPVAITAGGALTSGSLFFAAGPRLWSFRLP